LARRAVDFGARLYPRECIAKRTESLDESFGGVGHSFSAISLARLDTDQRFEVFFFAEVLAFQLHCCHGEGLAFLDGDGDSDVLFVGRDGHLRGLNVELQIATVQVISTQRFQVGIQLGARITVGLGVKVQPAAVV